MFSEVLRGGREADAVLDEIGNENPGDDSAGREGRDSLVGETLVDGGKGQRRTRSLPSSVVVMKGLRELPEEREHGGNLRLDYLEVAIDG